MTQKIFSVKSQNSHYKDKKRNLFSEWLFCGGHFFVLTAQDLMMDSWALTYSTNLWNMSLNPEMCCYYRPLQQITNPLLMLQWFSVDLFSWILLTPLPFGLMLDP